MPRDLTALKVKIGVRVDGRHNHPDFNLLPVVAASGMDWAYYVDRFGEGWKYDSLVGHADDDPANDSPVGTWLGMLVVPEQFADEAIAAFPSVCSRMTEAECQDFYDNRHAVSMRDESRDETALNSLKLERELMVARGKDTTALDAKIDKALDPDDPEPGVRRNPRRRWASLKTRAGINYREPRGR